MQQKNVTTFFSFDLNKFDNPTGIFEIATSNTGKNIATFEGKKGIVRVSTTFSASGIYPIIKDGNIVCALVIVDDLKNADLEKLRKEYIHG